MNTSARRCGERDFLAGGLREGDLRAGRLRASLSDRTLAPFAEVEEGVARRRVDPWLLRDPFPVFLGGT
ncbi:MAG TPA: hypothetical protein VEV82_10165 [Actinomycetota bacterium]|nr:hypothetical protein [Actinomycetota bacterium]